MVRRRPRYQLRPFLFHVIKLKTCGARVCERGLDRLDARLRQ